mmetsp:Transcript_56156/g.168086  ORF Transcript_56156/g.168086 Transcript_56156/m.168086 type:complete len:280 (+) Transcript_56156:67-906(+)
MQNRHNSTATSRRGYGSILTTSLFLISTMSKSAVAMGVAVTERAQRFAGLLPLLPRPRRRVYFLRHGMTDWNRRGFVQGSGFDIPLNEDGVAQAGYAAEELAALPITVVASSHLSRAAGTADAVAVYHPGAARVTSKGFGEIDYGELEGKCLHSDDAEARRLKEQFDRVSLDMEGDVHAGYPGGETARQVETRARGALRQLLKDCPEDRHLVVVGHGRINRLLLASLLHGDATKFAPIEQGNTAISVVDYDPGEDGWTEVMLNYCAHTEDRGAASGGCY